MTIAVDLGRKETKQTNKFSTARECHNHRLQTMSRHHEEATQSIDSHQHNNSKANRSLFLSKMTAKLESAPKATPINEVLTHYTIPTQVLNNNTHLTHNKQNHCLNTNGAARMLHQRETTGSSSDSLHLRPYSKLELLLKERIRSQRERILSFKSSSLWYGKSLLPYYM